MHRSEPRALFHCLNGNGLGHFMRLVSLASELRTKIPELHPLVLTSCEDPGFAWREGIPTIKVPSEHSPGKLAMEAGVVRSLSRQVAASTFAAFNPTIVITDTFPTGQFQELTPYLHEDVLKICVLGTMNLTSRDTNKGLELYNKAFISLPRMLQGRTAELPPDSIPWIDPILPRTPERCLERSQARYQLRLPQDKTIVLVTVGGGGDGSVANRLQLTIEVAGCFPEILFAVVQPPLAQFSIRVLGAGNVTSVSYTPLQEVLSAFDAAISAVGPSSIGEHFCADLPTIWLAQGPNAPDQAINAKAVADTGAGIVLSELNEPGLRNAIQQIVDPLEAAKFRALMRPYAGSGTQAGADLILQWWREHLGN